jgi:hypothetical protein
VIANEQTWSRSRKPGVGLDELHLDGLHVSG